MSRLTGTCSRCKSQIEAGREGQPYCTPCNREYQRAYKEKNRQARRDYAKTWYANLPEDQKATIRKITCDRRKSEKGRAYRREYTRSYVHPFVQPTWANQAKIDAIYRQCSEIERQTGVRHHVDHIVPIKSKIVCGLHVENNLQILTAFENLSKGNKL